MRIEILFSLNVLVVTSHSPIFSCSNLLNQFSVNIINVIVLLVKIIVFICSSVDKVFNLLSMSSFMCVSAMFISKILELSHNAIQRLGLSHKFICDISLNMIMQVFIFSRMFDVRVVLVLFVQPLSINVWWFNSVTNLSKSIEVCN